MANVFEDDEIGIVPTICGGSVTVTPEAFRVGYQSLSAGKPGKDGQGGYGAGGGGYGVQLPVDLPNSIDRNFQATIRNFRLLRDGIAEVVGDSHAVARIRSDIGGLTTDLAASDYHSASTLTGLPTGGMPSATSDIYFPALSSGQMKWSTSTTDTIYNNTPFSFAYNDYVNLNRINGAWFIDSALRWTPYAYLTGNGVDTATTGTTKPTVKWTLNTVKGGIVEVDGTDGTIIRVTCPVNSMPFLILETLQVTPPYGATRHGWWCAIAARNETASADGTGFSLDSPQITTTDVYGAGVGISDPPTLKISINRVATLSYGNTFGRTVWFDGPGGSVTGNSSTNMTIKPMFGWGGGA